MTGFNKSFCPFFSKNVPIHFNAAQNISPTSLLNGLMMVTNEGSIACNCFKKGNVWEYTLKYCEFCSYLKYFKYRLP